MDDATKSELYAEGNEVFKEVYAGDLPPLPEGFLEFNDVMVRTLFAQVWSRTVLPRRDMRLLIMGVCAARGATDAWKIQAQSALKNGELTAEELRETIITLASYAGYPSVSPLVMAAEEVIRNVESASTQNTD